MTLVMRKNRAVETQRPGGPLGPMGPGEEETGANPGVESDTRDPRNNSLKRKEKYLMRRRQKEDPTLLSTPGQESEIQAYESSWGRGLGKWVALKSTTHQIRLKFLPQVPFATDALVNTVSHSPCYFPAPILLRELRSLSLIPGVPRPHF